MWPARKRFVHTVLFQTWRDIRERPWATENRDRLTAIKEVARAVGRRYGRHYNLIAFPGGWFGCNDIADLMRTLEADIAHSILRRRKRMYIAFGVDSWPPFREMAIVMNCSGVVAVAPPCSSEEDRAFVFGGRVACVLACNEPGAMEGAGVDADSPFDLALVLVHGFWPTGQLSGSGRYSLSLEGLARRLGCPVFAPAGFFMNRNIGKWRAGIAPEREGLIFRETVITEVPAFDGGIAAGTLGAGAILTFEL